MFNILLVEDDRELSELFSVVLKENGYNIFNAENGEIALELLDHQFIDLIITDIMMPVLDGYELIKLLRDANFTQPILVITAKGSIVDKQKGFDLGVDDYMVKPINVNEMVWRVSALLRRSQAIKDHFIKVGDTTFDCNTLMVSNSTSSIELPKKEFYLLYKLISTPGKIFTRNQLFEEIWGFDSETDEHTLEVHISRLRDKFKDNKDFEIATIRGLGYKAVKRNG